MKKTENEYYGAESAKSMIQEIVYNLHPYLPDAGDIIIKYLGDCTNDDVLEIGCGEGLLSRKLAPLCKKLNSIDLVAKNTNTIGFPNLTIENMDAHKTRFDDESFDAVVGTYILHHLDLEKGMLEIKRVLKPRGVAIFVEPLAGNPISNLWRKMTPNYHTKDEKPISYTDIKNMGKLFLSVEYREFNFLNLGGSLFYIFTHNPEHRKRFSEFLTKYDKRFLDRFGLFKGLAGNVLITLRRGD